MTIANANQAQAQFVAPQVSEDIDLLFSLTVTDAQNRSSTAQVSVTVRNTPVPPLLGLDDELAPQIVSTLAAGCDFLDPHYCLYPFPNDFFAVSDSTATTGKRLNLNIAAMPRNVLGKPVDPTEWNRNDGFSPGALIETRVPNLSLDDGTAATNYQRDGMAIPHISNLQVSLDHNSSVVVIDAATGKQQLVWAELDANVTKFGPCDLTRPVAALAGIVGGQADQVAALARQVQAACESQAGALNTAGQNNPAIDPGPALLIHAGVNFAEGHRYIVALRRLRDAQGKLLQPSPGFRVYRDAIPSRIPQVEARRAHVEELFATLRKSEAAIDRMDLYLAWDFTVASESNLTERALHIRDDAFANYLPTVGGTPQFSVGSVQDFTVAQNASIARTVQGTVTVPNYMNPPGLPAAITNPLNPILGQSPIPLQYVGGRLYYDPLTGQAGAPPPAYGNEFPSRNPLAATDTFTFTCNIPRSAIGGSSATMATATAVIPARPSLYGHGLLGDQGEVNAGNVQSMSNEHNFLFCATDWIGMSSQDLVNVATILLDVSNFPTLADRVQQGFLNFDFLARLMKDPKGFSSNAAFQVKGQSVIDNRAVFYDGNSQGGIMGGAMMALSPDIQRGVLGVPGMNYSLLLSRSTDFATYSAFLYASYQASLDQQLLFSLMQMLWDRGENDGYAQHLGPGGTADPRVGHPNVALPGLPAGAYDTSKGPFDPVIPRMTGKEILLNSAYGDHQVSMWSADVLARTIGAGGVDAYFRRPGECGGAVTHCFADKASYLRQRLPNTPPFFALAPLNYADPQVIRHSAMVQYDHGKTAQPPLSNTPPTADSYDPHEYPRSTIISRCQKARFLRTDGRVIYSDQLPSAASCPLVDGAGGPFAKP